MEQETNSQLGSMLVLWIVDTVHWLISACSSTSSSTQAPSSLSFPAVSHSAVILRLHG